MGMVIGGNILQAKKLTTLTSDVNDVENRIFKNLIEDKPTHCLMLRNVLKLNEIDSRNDYEELEQSVTKEMERYGTVITVHTPKPRKNGDTQGVAGFGKVYVRYE